MAVRDRLVRPVAQFVEMWLGLAVFGDTIAQGSKTCHDSESQQEGQQTPEVVLGQRLGQDGKRHNHVMNLLHERLYGSYILR